MQPYLLNVNLGLPAHLQGRTVSALNFANELLALCLVAPFGALADKIGRRSVYAFGFLWLAAGFLLYPLARTVAAARRLRAVLLGGRRRHRHHVRDGARGYARRRIARPAGRARGLLPGPGRGRAGAAARASCRNTWPTRASTRSPPGRITLWLAAALCALSAVLVFAGLQARHAERARAGHAAASHPARTASPRRGAIRASGSPTCCSSAPSAIAWCSARSSRCACSRPGSSGTVSMADAADARAAAVRRGDGRGPCHRARRRRAARPRGSPAHRRGRHGARGGCLSAVRLHRRSDAGRAHGWRSRCC